MKFFWRQPQQILALRVDKPEFKCCPFCGEPMWYASTRTLWSLLPGVCDHAIADWSLRDPQSDDKMKFDQIVVTGAVYRLPQPGRPFGRSRTGRFFVALRRRLKEEIRGERLAWWGPLTRAEAGRRRNARRSIRSMEEMFSRPAVDAGRRALDVHRQDLGAR